MNAVIELTGWGAFYGGIALLSLILAAGAIYFWRRRLLSRADAALLDSQRRFQTMADAIPQLAWIARPDGWIEWYNRRWYEYTGTTPEEVEGWGWQSVHDPQMLPTALERWKESLASGKPFDMVLPLRARTACFGPF